MLLNSAADVFRAGDPYEQLIQNIIQVESQPRFRLEDELFGQEQRKSVLSDLDSKLSALDTLLDRLVDPLSHPFNGRSANLSDSTAFTVQSNDDAAYGSHVMQVDRLATVDTRISDQFTASASTIGTGTKNFTISVASPTEADEANRESIAVSVDITATTDEEALDEIAAAINAAMLDAYNDGTIESLERANASVVKETSDSARLSLRSGQTGYNNRIEFSADPDGLLASLGISNAALAAGTTGGQVKNVGTSEDTSDLSSQIQLDGLTIYRDSNQITDALDGLTLTLKEANAKSYEFSVTPDSSGIEDEVNDFIEKYNDILAYIKSKSNVDGESGIRGILAGDSSFTTLRLNMRENLITKVDGQPADGPSQITDLGIELQSDGRLKLDDAETLLQVVEQDPDAVRDLFGGDDGIGTRLINSMEDFLGFKGIIFERKSNIDTRISNLNERIARVDDQLARREESLRSEFARLQEAIQLFQGQQASLAAVRG